MKRLYLWMMAAILSCGFWATSCSVNDNPVDPRALTNDVDEFWDLHGNDGDSAVVAALMSIDNVEDLKPFYNENLGQAYYFNYNQLIDHNNPSKGTFKQQVVLTFVGKDAPTILHTQGYSLVGYGAFGNNHNRLDSIYAPHFLWALSKDYGKDKKFDLNCVQVEYRYHGFSLPEGDKDSFKYLSAEQQSEDLHAIVTDLKKALITGSGKWLSTGVSKNGMTTYQYAYFDELNGWDDIDVYVPFTAPVPVQSEDMRIGEYMLTKSSKEVLADLERVYKKLVNDRAVADSTMAAYKVIYKKENNGEAIPTDSVLLFTLGRVLNNLFDLQSYGDFDTWSKLIPKENDDAKAYAAFFMLDKDSKEIDRETSNVRGPLHWRRNPFDVQTTIDQGNVGFDYTWFLDGELLSAADKGYLKSIMQKSRESKAIDLQLAILKNLETTTKKLIFVYGEDDPWTGAAIPDPTNPNVKKYIVPHGTHTDDFKRYAWYPGGQEVVDKIMADVKAILYP